MSRVAPFATTVLVSLTLLVGANIVWNPSAAGFCAYMRTPVAPREPFRAVRGCLDDVTGDAPWIDPTPTGLPPADTHAE